jgi:autotransporter passenger strand-loop-strand repeat protein
MARIAAERGRPQPSRQTCRASQFPWPEYVAITVSGVQSIEFAGTAISTLLVGGDAQLEVNGLVSGAVLSGGAMAVIGSGGTDVGTTVTRFSLETVLGGTSTSATISSGGAEIVGPGFDGPMGLVVSATVLSGATLQLNSGGVASGVTVESAGTLILGGGASMSGVSLASGAVLEYADTTFTSFTVASGSALVASGGEAFNTIVDGGGLANFHGTTVIGGTISGGGTLALLDNAAAGGTFTFAGGGTLQVEVPHRSLR